MHTPHTTKHPHNRHQAGHSPARAHEHAQASATHQHHHQKTSPRKKNSTMYLLFFAVLGLVLLTGGAYYLWQNSSSNTLTPSSKVTLTPQYEVVTNLRQNYSLFGVEKVRASGQVTSINENGSEYTVAIDAQEYVVIVTEDTIVGKIQTQSSVDGTQLTYGVQVTGTEALSALLVGDSVIITFAQPSTEPLTRITAEEFYLE